ncbi:hypothetical protein ACS0TY_017469 [Phlomoides rotata]
MEAVMCVRVRARFGGGDGRRYSSEASFEGRGGGIAAVSGCRVGGALNAENRWMQLMVERDATLGTDLGVR